MSWRHFVTSGVFNFDGHLFSDLRDEKKDLMTYCRYYISDHDPLWAGSRVR